MSKPGARTNEELALAAYDAINRGDVEAFVAVIHPEVEFQSLVAEAEGTTYRGHEGVREWWNKVAGNFASLQFELEEFVDYGDRGFARLLVKGTVADVEVPQRMWQAFMMSDGKPVWWQSYRTEAEARAALESL